MSNQTSAATSNNAIPKKDQAIILDSAKGLFLNDYIITIGKLVGPKHIKSASESFKNNNICMYLSSAEIAAQLVEDHPVVTIRNNEIKIRRLFTPTKRLLISNVCSSIPNEAIEQSLKTIGLKLVSPITTVKLNIDNKEYSHIESFQRQVYISPSWENAAVPTTFTVNWENTPHRFVLSQDEEMVCFTCKKTGHTNDQCPTLNQQSNAVTSTQPFENPLLRKNQELPLIPQMLTTDPNTNQNVTAALNCLLFEPTKSYIPKIPRKKLYQELLIKDIDKALEPLKTIITKEPTRFVLPFNTFKRFIQDAIESKNPTTVAEEYTDNIPALIMMISTLHPYLNDSGIKNRFTRLKNKLVNNYQNNTLMMLNRIAMVNAQLQAAKTDCQE